LPWRQESLIGLHQHVENRVPIPRTSYLRHHLTVLLRSTKGCGYQIARQQARRLSTFRIMLYRTPMIVLAHGLDGKLASRLLGFVRDSMIAALLAPSGRGCVLAAFQMVNVVRGY